MKTYSISLILCLVGCVGSDPLDFNSPDARCARRIRRYGRHRRNGIGRQDLLPRRECRIWRIRGV